MQKAVHLNVSYYSVFITTFAPAELDKRNQWVTGSMRYEVIQLIETLHSFNICMYVWTSINVLNVAWMPNMETSFLNFIPQACSLKVCMCDLYSLVCANVMWEIKTKWLHACRFCLNKRIHQEEIIKTVALAIKKRKNLYKNTTLLHTLLLLFCTPGMF